MASTASLRNTSLGRYWPTGSGIHALDPRSKLLVVLFLTVGIVVAGRWWLTVALLATLLLLFPLSRLPRAALSGALRPVLPVLVVLALFQLLFGLEPAGMPGAGVVLWIAGRFTLTLGRIVGVLVSLARLLSLVLLVSLLTATTSPVCLSPGWRCFAGSNRLRLPGHELALTGAIALRFLPILGEELESVQRAQLAHDITGGPESRWQIARNARRTAALIVRSLPMLFDASISFPRPCSPAVSGWARAHLLPAFGCRRETYALGWLHHTDRRVAF